MITGSVKKRISMEAILSKITPYDIYRYFCPTSFALDELFCSPMPGRTDRSPSFVIGTKKGKLRHFDYGDSTYRGDCFDFVQQLHMLPEISDALKMVDKHFGLGFSDEPIKDYRSAIITYQQPARLEKKPALVQVAPRSLNSTELKYWAMYHQTREDTEREGIFGIKTVLLNKQRVHLPATELAFAYKLEDKWKIYRPFAEKKLKWYPNSFYNEMMEGLHDLKPDKPAVILGSRKDRMVVRKVIETVCSTQNESISAFTIESVDYIKENSIEQYLGWDGDEPGKKNSHAATDLFNFRHVNVPDHLVRQGIKDFAEMGKRLGLQAIAEHFTLKGII